MSLREHVMVEAINFWLLFGLLRRRKAVPRNDALDFYTVFLLLLKSP